MAGKGDSLKGGVHCMADKEDSLKGGGHCIAGRGDSTAPCVNPRLGTKHF
jgi:hypothetical protein